MFNFKYDSDKEVRKFMEEVFFPKTKTKYYHFFEGRYDRMDATYLPHEYNDAFDGCEHFLELKVRHHESKHYKDKGVFLQDSKYYVIRSLIDMGFKVDVVFFFTDCIKIMKSENFRNCLLREGCIGDAPDEKNGKWTEKTKHGAFFEVGIMDTIEYPQLGVSCPDFVVNDANNGRWAARNQ